MTLGTDCASLLPADGWILRQPERNIAIPFAVPGDIHTALATHGLIPEPYFRDNEYTVDWVSQTAWQLTTDVVIHEIPLDKQAVLTLEQIDCLVDVSINDVSIGTADSQFVRWQFVVSNALMVGRNRLALTFNVARHEAIRRAQQFPFEVPYLEWNCRAASTNFLRKSACHAGWDWNICLMPSGIYGDATLRLVSQLRLDEIKCQQIHDATGITVHVTAYVTAFAVTTPLTTVKLCGRTVESEQSLYPDRANQIEIAIRIDDPELWWPVGLGPP